MIRLRFIVIQILLCTLALWLSFLALSISWAHTHMHGMYITLLPPFLKFFTPFVTFLDLSLHADAFIACNANASRTAAVFFFFFSFDWYFPFVISIWMFFNQISKFKIYTHRPYTSYPSIHKDDKMIVSKRIENHWKHFAPALALTHTYSYSYMTSTTTTTTTTSSTHAKMITANRWNVQWNMYVTLR